MCFNILRNEEQTCLTSSVTFHFFLLLNGKTVFLFFQKNLKWSVNKNINESIIEYKEKLSILNSNTL